MSRTVWVLVALIAALSIAHIWRDSQGMPAPSYTLCKESLVTQIFTGLAHCGLKAKQQRLNPPTGRIISCLIWAKMPITFGL